MAIVILDIGVYVCLDCGAYSSTEIIKHYESCSPGSAEKWNEYYKQQDEESDKEKESEKEIVQ